jgi:hypothetical protein
MTPEERREDAELAVNEWREELRARRPEVRRPLGMLRRVWVDSGSGPGHEVQVPTEAE